MYIISVQSPGLNWICCSRTKVARMRSKILVYSGDNIESFMGCRCVNYKDAGKIVGR